MAPSWHAAPPFLSLLCSYLYARISHDFGRFNVRMQGQNVTVVSSGINAQSAALCVMEILQCASHIKDLIYSGTAGFSPAVGALPRPAAAAWLFRFLTALHS